MAFNGSALLAGIGAGILYSLSAWGKKKDQKFDFSKFAVTLLAGVVTGVITAIMDLPVGAAYEFTINLGAIPLLENVVKIVWRKVINIV